MFEVVKYKKEHALQLLNEPMNSDQKMHFSEEQAKSLEMDSAFTGLWNGKPIVCGGIVPIWTGRGCVWTLFGTESKEHFIVVFRAIQKFLWKGLQHFNRIEVAIPYSFQLGQRRARMLGFVLECEYAPKYLPDGTDCKIYVMVKGFA